MNQKLLSSYQDTLLLMKKKILLNESKILYDQPVTRQSLTEDWTIHHSEWEIKEDWLVGSNRRNWPGIAILKKDFPGNVLVEFEAQTMLPSSHDINVM